MQAIIMMTQGNGSVMPNKNCSNCGKTYYQRPDTIRGDGKFYCCVKCRVIDQRTVLCKFCKQPFIPDYNPKSPTGKNIYCSQSCSTKARWEAGGFEHERLIFPNVIVCKECNNEFKPKRDPKAQYCSRKCARASIAKARTVAADIENVIIQAYHSGKTQDEAGKMYGYSRGATQKIFKRRNITARPVPQREKGRVFSDTHKQRIATNHADVSGKNNPMFGRQGGNPNGWGKVTQSLGIKFRSTWEAVIAETFASAGITFEYEKHRIYLGDLSTLVDFYLPDYDIYVEVKGRVNAHFKEVLRRFAEIRPDITYLVIGEEDYNIIAKYPGHLLTLVYDIA